VAFLHLTLNIAAHNSKRMQQRSSWFSKPRVETFSDGVFAIIITILVLELKIPKISEPNSVRVLWMALVDIMPKFLSWVISFFILCVIWVNHHRLFESLTHITYRIFWWNAYLLLWCALIPFPTALVGDYPHNPLALFIFGIVLSLMGSGFYFLRTTIVRENLLIENVTPKEFKKDNFKSLFFGCILYLIGACLAWIHPGISFLIYAFIPFYFIFLNVKSGNKLASRGRKKIVK
jgi:uncharacterized membrane protein